MSDSSGNSHSAHARGGPLLSFIGVIGTIVLFGVVVGIAYLPNRPAPVDAEIIDERITRLAETRAVGESALREYRVVDRDAGVVVLPIDRAMELVVAETAERNGGND